jgi:hypothetical protein
MLFRALARNRDLHFHILNNWSCTCSSQPTLGFAHLELARIVPGACQVGSCVHYQTNKPNLVLTYNDNDSDAKRGNKLNIEFREVGMKNASHYRALASLYRQQAAYNPAQKWHLLGQAERWEHLAVQELASHFEECNADQSSAKPANDLAA